MHILYSRSGGGGIYIAVCLLRPAEVLAKMEVKYGLVTDKAFGNDGTVLCYALSSVTYGPLGFTHTQVSQFYPYGDFTSHRKRLFSTMRCTADTRSTPGKIHVALPPTSHEPIIVGLVTQFGLGLPSDKNPYYERVKLISKDLHYKEGLQADTTVHRREYLTKCIKSLIKFAKKQTDVHTLVIPRGMAMSGGIVNEDWENIYLPLYTTLAEELRPYSIKTIILDSVGKPMVSIK